MARKSLDTVMPHLEGHTDRIIFERFLKSIDLILQEHILLQRQIVENIIVLSNRMQSIGYALNKRLKHFMILSVCAFG